MTPLKSAPEKIYDIKANRTLIVQSLRFNRSPCNGNRTKKLLENN